MEPEQIDAPVTVVLADDHVIVRDGIRMVLESEPDVQVVAEAGTAEDAARYVLGHKPSILVLDLNMPGESSLDLIPSILKSSPDTRIIVLTKLQGPVSVWTPLQVGASVFVLKYTTAKDLVGGIHTARMGETALKPSLGPGLTSAPAAGATPV